MAHITTSQMAWPIGLWPGLKYYMSHDIFVYNEQRPSTKEASTSKSKFRELYRFKIFSITECPHIVIPFSNVHCKGRKSLVHSLNRTNLQRRGAVSLDLDLASGIIISRSRSLDLCNSKFISTPCPVRLIIETKSQFSCKLKKKKKA